MTLQVAMIGRDGWVLASDRNARHPSRATSLTNKIRFGPEWACSFWGDDCAEIVCGRIVDALRLKRISLNRRYLDYLRQLSNEVWRSEYDSQSRFPEAQKLPSARERGVILMLKGRPREIIEGMIGRDSIFRSLANTRLIKGDSQGNFALFFAQHYYDAVDLLSVSMLKQLASHTILMSRYFNTQNIEGLQIVACQDGIISELADSEIGRLKARSERIDAALRKALCG